MNTNRIRLLAAACSLWLLGASAAHAVVLSLSPASQFAAPGDTVSLDLTIEGLGNFSGPSVSNFDLDLLFDPTALNFMSYSLGPFLGDVGAFEAIDFSLGDLGGGVLALGELSLLSIADLTALQPSAFTLATLEFEVAQLAAGDFTQITFGTVYSLGDAFGRPLQLEGTNAALIRNGMAVAAPAPWLLMLLGAGALSRTQRRRLPK